MGGELQAAAQGYTRLADDERLSDPDRARFPVLGMLARRDPRAVTTRHRTRPVLDPSSEVPPSTERQPWVAENAIDNLKLSHVS
jgi:hypothetical protein